MKTRRLLIISLVAALLVVYYLIGTGYLKQRDEKDVMAAQIAETTAALALVPLPPADLDEQLADAEDSLWEVQDTFNIDTNDTRIVNRILRLADEQGVKAIPLSTQNWTLERIFDQDYSVLHIDMEVTGNFTQMVNFLYQLENSEPKTLILEELTVEKTSGCCLSENTIEGPITANIRIAVYTLPASN